MATQWPHEIPRCELQTPDLELIGGRVHRLYLTVQGVVLSVQGMLLTVLTGFHHLYCDLNVTQRLQRTTRHILEMHCSTCVCNRDDFKNSADAKLDRTSSSAIFCFSSSSVRMSGGVFTLENNVLRQTFVNLDFFFFNSSTVVNGFKCCSPKVMRDAGVELVARFHKVTLAALLFQTIFNLLEGHVAGADLARRQLPCVHRHHESLTDVRQEGHWCNATLCVELQSLLLRVYRAHSNHVRPTGRHWMTARAARRDYTALAMLILQIPECCASSLSDYLH